MPKSEQELRWRNAAQVRVPFGKYQGRTLKQVGDTDDGLLYLDWMRGIEIKDRAFREALAIYLDDPTIAAELTELIEER